MFLSFPVTELLEAKAVHIRTERDRKYGNIYQQAHTDKRWVGDVGEICFNNWLKQMDLTINIFFIYSNQKHL